MVNERLSDVNMVLNREIMEKINNDIYRVTGMSYDEFSKLDFDEQQKLIKEYHKKNNKRIFFRKKENCSVMIGSGEETMFVKVKKGTKVMLFDGTVVDAGITLDEYWKCQEDRINKIAKVSVKERIRSLFRRK